MNKKKTDLAGFVRKRHKQQRKILRPWRIGETLFFNDMIWNVHSYKETKVQLQEFRGSYMTFVIKDVMNKIEYQKIRSKLFKKAMFGVRKQVEKKYKGDKRLPFKGWIVLEKGRNPYYYGGGYFTRIYRTKQEARMRIYDKDTKIVRIRIEEER